MTGMRLMAMRSISGIHAILALCFTLLCNVRRLPVSLQVVSPLLGLNIDVGYI